MQVCVNSKEATNKAAVVRHCGGQPPVEFSIVSNFSSGVVAATSVPQAFIVPTNANSVTIIGDIAGTGHGSLHVNTITGNRPLVSNGEGFAIKQCHGLQQANGTQTEDTCNAGGFQPIIRDIILQPNQSAGNVLREQLGVDKCNVVPGSDSTVPKSAEKYFFLDTEEEVEEVIHKHTEETFSHFVVAKKTKAYGSKANVIDTSTRFRIHWQSRDLTSTEECAVQIPFQGVPFIYIGEKAYMCHLGRNKCKIKPALQPDVEITDLSQPKKHRSRLTKKQGCPAKIFVKQIAKFPAFRISCNSEYLRTQMSQKLRKAIMNSNGHVNYVIQYVGTLPDISEHSNHDIGENTPVKEPIDPLIRDKIIELTWQFGDSIPPREIKDMLDFYVCELFKGRDLPLKNRRRFYPSEKDIANYIYKSKLLSKFMCADREHITLAVDALRQEHPGDKFILELELDSNYCQTTVEFVDGFRVIKDTNSVSTLQKQKFLFVYQSACQQRLLKLYGRQVILTEISKRFQNIPFPFFGVFVPTNVDYQLVYCFAVQSRTLEYLREGLSYLLKWNSSWTPKFLVVDFSADQMSIVEEMFPSSCVLISDLSREESWMEWLSEPKNCATLHGSKDEVYEKLTAIANSFTEEALNQAAQSLENSQEWRLSESLRDWFTSEWLAEAKRWVAGYRHDEFMSSYHTDANLASEVSNLRECHSNHLRNKRMADFISSLVKVVIPGSFQRYVEKNVSDYRLQYFLQNSNIPMYLRNKTASVTSYVLLKMKEAKSEDYLVSQIQSGIFWITDKVDNDVNYTVSFGSATTLPSCVCLDWLQYKLPCKHMVSVFLKIPEWDWGMISDLYITNPILSIDFSCIDTRQEESFLVNWKKEESVKFCVERGYIHMLNRKEDDELIHAVKSSERPLASSAAEKDTDSVTHLPYNPDPNISDHDNTSQLDTLATDCNNFCQQLSNNIHQVGDHTVLQKLKLDLQAVLNNVNIELLKTSEVPINKRLSTNDVDDDTRIENIKCDKESSALNVTANATSKSTEHTPHSQSKSEELLTMVPSPMPSRKRAARAENSEVWIFDPELNVKLLKSDRYSILDGQTLSLEIIMCVQNILKHQFSDVDGFCDPQKLGENSIELSTSSKQKVMQLHPLDGDHWSVYARTLQDVRIFCCTISSKANVIEQVLKMVPGSSCEDKILFVERAEKEDNVKNCSLYAIAYSVAYLFDIEARNFVFAENEMRPHLAECLEDMCFSMFPIRTTLKKSF